MALHGWQDNKGTWNRLAPLLPQHIGLLCIDFPGHGQSSKYPRGIRHHEIDYVHVIIRIMKEYNWQKVSLIAHSTGSTVAFIYASLYPRTVDMFIALDLVKPSNWNNDLIIKLMHTQIENMLVADEKEEKTLKEPPSFLFEQLEKQFYENWKHSIDLHNCKHLLNEIVIKSQQYPNKYYVSTDPKTRYGVQFTAADSMIREMAKRIGKTPYMLIRSSNPLYVNDDSNEVIEILRQNSNHFEIHQLNGTHHLHLNNPEEVAALVNPFILKHRPVLLKSWTVDDEIITNPVVKPRTNKRYVPGQYLRRTTKLLRSRL